MKRKHIVASIACIVVFVAALVFTNTEKDSLWEEYYNQKREKKLRGESSNKQARILALQEYFKGIKTKLGEEETEYPVNYLMAELNKVKANQNLKTTSEDEFAWQLRGPSNVGGRTRAIVVDPDDATHNTWYAGSATGGAWKTTDGGENWEHITADIPYLATTSIVMPKSNTNVLYLGTGESFPGSMETTGGGIFKSTDKGATWSQLTSTATNDDFRWVNRLVVDPNDENLLLAATTTGIFRTEDGGVTWETVYTSNGSIEDIVADTTDFKHLYAGEKGQGVLCSSDSGKTWVNNALDLMGGKGRAELAVSPANPAKVYASLENSDNAQIYVSHDRGENWMLFGDSEMNSVDFLGGQGSYDNTICAHPYNEDVVFAGGVNLWKFTASDSVYSKGGTVTGITMTNTQSFLDFVNFTGNLFTGMNTGDKEEATDLHDTDFVKVEIRFGPGISQMAHRFFVPELATSGVSASEYTYQDYVEVPFQVWDVTNNKQLMCSFRDQERNGVFDLYERDDEESNGEYGLLGREYLFINAVDYDAVNPDPNIAVTAGRSYKLIYFFWPTLAEGGTWDADNLPESNLLVDYMNIDKLIGVTENVSDAYGQYSGDNIYNQSLGINNTSIPGFHPDHHALVTVPVNESTGEFWILNGNDGGLGISKDNGETFTQIKNKYLTTQFYGVAKKPGSDEYIGGMQDNGTWQSASGEDANQDSEYYFRLGGDGFETLWNQENGMYILASQYYNAIYLSKNGGKSWTEATNGISSDDGPFITKLTAVPSKPNKVFAVGSNGVFRSTNFGELSWREVGISGDWAPYGVTSSHNIEVSLANDSIVWTGAGNIIESGYGMHVSVNQGTSFTQVAEPANPIPSLTSGLATHPKDENTAYLLYSLYGEAKILRTTDLGQTWEDITGFDETEKSTNGFPDVGCLSLFVFPDNTDRIWAGTEIGIMESLDNGATWNYLDSSIEAVPIWQIFHQDDQIVVATYGRGIWTAQYEVTTSVKNVEKAASITIYPNPSTSYINVSYKEALGDAAVTLNIINMSGAIVKTVDGYMNNTRVNVGDLASGNYIVRVSSGNRTIQRNIVIAQ